MSKVEITPATRADFEEAFTHLYGEFSAPPVRVAGFAGRLDGKVIGIGGIAFYPDGARVAFCDVGDDGRRCKVSLHRAALMTLALAKRMGVRKLIVTEANMHEKSPAWLARLGFEKMTTGGMTLYVRDLIQG